MSRRVLSVLVGTVLPALACMQPPSDLVVLAPAPEGGRLGSATVTAGGTTVDLTTERVATKIVAGQPPGTPAPLAQADVDRLFGPALSAQPAAPVRFVLYFESGSDQLTAEGTALMPQILAAVQGRPAPDLTVVGHTDSTGQDQANFELGLTRARLIRDQLVALGVDTRIVEVTSHGEADPLVRTPDETAEPRNRRVEVTVR